MARILFRENQYNREEAEIARKYFDVINIRCACAQSIDFWDQSKTSIIGRYSVLPHYYELVKDLSYVGCKLVNSFSQHNYIANFGWYSDVMEYTPKTWFDDLSHCDYEGPFVVKGRTNSKKNQWKTKMYARDRKDALCIASELMSDDYIAEQGIVFRKYIPLKTLEVGVCGTPFTNEWRFFFYKNKLVTYGYYWEVASDESIAKAEITPKGIAFAQQIADIISKKTNFFVLDIAETQNPDEWILIEVNDGQCSGLQMIDPNEFYRSLSLNIKE